MFVPWEKRSAENRARRNETRRQWRADNPDRYYEQTKRHNAKYRGANLESVKAKQKEWREANKVTNNSRIRAFNIARKRKVRHILSWQFRAELAEFYKEARRLTEATGVLHVVDHIWPINGEDSCGLHVPWNLRVVTQQENDSKGNKRPDDPGVNMEIYHACRNRCLHDV